MAVTLTYLLFNTLAMYSIYSFIDNFLGKRKFSRHIIILSYSIYYIVLSTTFLTLRNTTLNIIINLSFNFMMGFLYDTSILKRFLAAVFVYSLLLVCDMFASTLLIIISDLPYNLMMDDSSFFMTGIALCMILQFIIVKMITPPFRSRETELPRSYWFAVFLIPSVSIYILCSMNALYISGGISKLSFVFLTMFGIFAINILVFFLYHKLIRDAELKYENILLLQQTAAYEDQANLIQHFRENLHEEKHDMKGHMAAVLHLLEQRQLDPSIDYIKNLIGRINTIETGINSGNVVIDAIVNSKLYIASTQNTNLHIDLKISDSLEMDPVDLTTLLCNLLDNALEASIKLPANNRNIWLQLSLQHNILILNITNTYNVETIDLRDGQVYTTKADKNSHGLGLKRIQKVIERYNGTFKYRIYEENDTHLFVTEAMLYLQ